MATGQWKGGQSTGHCLVREGDQLSEDSAARPPHPAKPQALPRTFSNELLLQRQEAFWSHPSNSSQTWGPPGQVARYFAHTDHILHLLKASCILSGSAEPSKGLGFSFCQSITKYQPGVPVVAQWLMNPTSNHEVAGSDPWPCSVG